MLHTVSQESEYVEYESLFDLQFYGEQTGQEQLPSIKSSQEQIPTPPLSPPDECMYVYPHPDQNSQVVISVSTRFLPDAQLSKEPVDLTLQSEDSVFFYVSSEMLLKHSDNRFGSLIPTPLEKAQIVYVAESAQVLNVVLHTVYEITLFDHSPPLSTIILAAENLLIYGLDPKVFVKPSKPLYTALLSYSPLYPLDVYALAGSLGLEDLARTTSSHLLSFPLSILTDEIAARIGAVYLIRLVRLHMFRTEELKAMLFTPPRPHPEISTCDFGDQRKLTRAWALAAAYLAWDARPNMSTQTVSVTFSTLAEALTCEACKQGLKLRVKDIITKWALLRLVI